MRRDTCIICIHLSVFPALKGTGKMHVYQSTHLGRKGHIFVGHVNEKVLSSMSNTLAITQNLNH